jgi:hypothetical protein
MTIRSSLGHLLALSVSGLLLLAACADPASGERLQTPDPVGDMIVVDDHAGTTNPAPNAAVGDITGVIVDHRVKALVLTVSFVDLRRTGKSGYIKGEIRGTGGAEWTFAAGGEPGNWAGGVDLWNAQFKEVSCNHSLDIRYDDNVMVLRIPNRCLKKPSWVRLSFGSIHRANDDKIFMDQAFNGGWSPRIQPGQIT